VFERGPRHKAIGANGQPFWLVESFVDAGFFNQARRDAAQVHVAKALLTVLGDDGSSVDGWEDSFSRLAGAHLLLC